LVSDVGVGSDTDAFVAGDVFDTVSDPIKLSVRYSDINETARMVG
jgi:hypothetical protein